MCDSHYVHARGSSDEKREKVTTNSTSAVNRIHELPPGTKVAHTRFDLSPQFVLRRSS